MVVWGDPNRLRQVLLNLVSNAIKFTSAGEVRLSVAHDETCALITVTDTGMGISSGLLPHVCERFRQGEDARPREWLGLGLAIARDIVELHEGVLRVDSHGVGNGTTCTVTLPLKRGAYVDSAAVRVIA